MKPAFKEMVLRAVRRIPRSKVLTYGEVAKIAGNPRAYRAVGNVLNANYDKNIPCHRVIRSSGVAGGYNRGAGKKIKILRREGIKI